MTTKNEIPSKSQQVIDQLKNTRKNIILTGSVSGVAEAYLYEYKKQCYEYQKQCDTNKIVTITEVHEVDSQKSVLDEFDLSFYIESSLVLNLCEQLMKRNVEIEKLGIIRIKMQEHCKDFRFSMEKNYKSEYQKGIYLNPILDYIKGKYKWEWLIANFDRPISNADKIQKCMYEYMNSVKKEPSRVILSAYDRNLTKNNSYGTFQVINLAHQKSYQQLKEEAMMILYHLYPILWRHYNVIESVLNCVELQNSYTTGEYTYEAFMTGLRKFYEAYHCIESSGCFISEDEFLSVIQDYIGNSRDNNQKKKSKLYI